MNIVKKIVPASKYSIKCPYAMNPEFIVVHNTANDATALAEIAYMTNNDKQTSFHYAIDDVQVVQGLPEDRNGWHAGDGASGAGNRKGIGIEICYSKSGGDKFIAAEKLAAQFIAEKLKEKGWGLEQVKKHQDFSGKYCPARTLDMGWQRFLDMVSAELEGGKEEASGNVLYRVQLGAYAVKENAEKQYRNIKAAGFDAFITKIGSLYKIQVGAFSKRANAVALLEKVKAAGYDAFITTTGGSFVPVAAEPEITVGSIVRVKKGANTYDGDRLATFIYTRNHVVKEVKGDRVVIMHLGTVVAAIDKADLVLV